MKNLIKTNKRSCVILFCLIALLCTGCALPEQPGDAPSQESGSDQPEESSSQESGSDRTEESSSQESGSDQPEESSSQESTSDTTTARDEQAVQMPDFEMTLLNGDSVSFSNYQGKKVILNFWATWCNPCVGEMPAFQRLTEEYPDELVILAVNCSEDTKTIQKFIEQKKYTFPVVPDEEGTIQAMFGGIRSIPVTVIIDEEGYIITSHVGASDADTMYEIYKEDLGL